MIHKMKLQSAPFNNIKNGTKSIEMRLYDEKRQLLNLDDIIEFTNMQTNETINCKVEGLIKFSSFKELYSTFDKKVLGYKENEQANPEDMCKYYSIEDQSKYGILAIKVKLKE